MQPELRRSPQSRASDDDLLDIRIALVLYGGVSLAIYENGVARCFYELVKRRGVFSILLDLLCAKAQVDVIAGTSAGGINGLLLAAVLESGADFADSAELWRRLGDFGALLRDVRDADTAQSLLKGETYYQDSLIDAFRKYCTPPDPSRFEEYLEEIDVYVTGTDLDGAERLNWDALGSPISDKEHRVVFHLEHRPNRKTLGCGRVKKAEVDTNEQGAILGTMARITSSFPAAFPPFRLLHLEAQHQRFGEAVRRALEATALSGISQTADRSFADGGLLDNKPFGPVLEAIFHRMPTGIVDRRLFYVEPDPEPRPACPNPQRHSALAVAAGALNTIPAHESIWQDLQQLARHNAQVKWLKKLRREADEELERRHEAAAGEDKGESKVASWAYWETRCECLARSLFLASEVTSPSAEDPVTNPAYRALIDLLSRKLKNWTAPVTDEGPHGLPVDRPLLNAFDVDFHLRRSFRLLYGLFERLQRPSPDESPGYRDKCRAAMRFTGRIIKAQKMIRDMLLPLRETIVREALRQLPEEEGQNLPERALFIVNLFRLFLRADAPHWESLRRHCAVAPDTLPDGRTDWASFFDSDDLSAAAEKAADVTKKPTEDLTSHLGGDVLRLLAADDVSVRWTILDEIERATRTVVDVHCRSNGDLDHLACVFDDFVCVDEVTYPLEFAGAIYELDEIEYVRISPQDAQTGLSEGNARGKVAGDELAHFSAFLRQDWRSNDILQGRLDGICQIIHSLLAPSASTVRRLAGYCADIKRNPGHAFDTRPSCRDGSWSALQDAWKELSEVVEHEVVADKDYAPSDSLKASLKLFRTCLIRVGQEDAFLEDFPSVVEDHFFQELAFSNAADSRDNAPTSVTVQQAEARERSRSYLQSVAGDDRDKTVDSWWNLYRKMNLGGQTVGGQTGGVPPHVVGEYATQAYLLLYGMIGTSIGRTGKAVLDQKTVRSVLRHPLAFLHVVFTLMRRAYIVALSSVTMTAGLLIGLAIMAYSLDRTQLMFGAIAALVFFVGIVSWAVPRMKKRQLLIALLPVFVALIAAATLFIGLELPSGLDSLGFWNGGRIPLVFAVGLVLGVFCSAAWVWSRNRK